MAATPRPLVTTSPRGRLLATDFVTPLSLGAVYVALLSFFPPSLLLLDSMAAGGDTPSFHHPIRYLRDVLLPLGMPQGWDPGNFGGYAPYQFYFLPPSLAVAALSAVLPFNVAFKLVTVAGTFLLPAATVAALRALGYPSPVPAIGAAASLLFLFNEGNSMWGGNIPSTLAGEFSFSIAFALTVLFLGLLHRGLEQGRSHRRLGVLLAVIGLCHPIMFLSAVAAGAYFLFDRRRWRRNLIGLALIYAVGGLLMSFWLVPLIARLPYATSIHWVWQFQSWREVVPPLLVPAAVLAAMDVVRIVRHARSGTAAGPGTYILFCLLTAVAAFGNATSLGIPDIRFIPFAQFTIVLLAVDLLAAVLRRLPMPALPSLALVAAAIGAVQLSTGFIPDWVRWNYEGIESKAGYPVLQRIAALLRGRLDDPRVAYEHSPSHEVFGSMRIFESLPTLAGRATLEGVLLQTAVTSPFVYSIQSFMSEQGTNVIPGYRYPSLDPVRGTARLDIFNVRDFLAVTDKVKAALDGDSRWTRLLTVDRYVVYRRRGSGSPPGYVRVPRYQPVLVETDAWKTDFHRWFLDDDSLEVPILSAADVPPAQRARFPLLSPSPTSLPHVPLPSDCSVQETLSALSIEFTTTCPGIPHWISMSYHPGWRVKGAAQVFLASPAFMLVIPEGRSVRLTFSRTLADWAGLAATLLGVGLCAVGGRLRPATDPVAPTPSPALGRTRAALIALVLAVTGWNTVRTVGAQYFYRRGQAAFARQEYPTARREFGRSLFFGRRASTAADAKFFHAASLFRSGEFAEAERAFAAIVRGEPDSFWAAESLYQVGLCQQALERPAEARDTFRRVATLYSDTPWAGHAAHRLRELEAAMPSARRP